MKRLAAIVFLPLCVADLQAQPRYDVQRLQRLEQVNQENKTARLVVALRDTVLLNATFKGNENELYRIYSITKLFSGLAAGLLWQKGYIKSPEDKLADYFAEWRSQPDKNTITLRHILQHQSGLFTTKGSKDIYGQPDFVAFALYDSLVSTPGHQYQYNNRAINLVSGLVQKTTGQTMRAFLDELLFRPLGIVRYEWPNDAAGNTWGMDGLRLSATDLAKVGMLIANKGQWKGQSIIAQQWFDWAFQLPLTNAMRGVGGYGLGIKTMFYDNRLLLPRKQVAQLEAKGLPTALAQRLYRMADTVYSDFVQFGNALQQRFSLAEAEAITVLASQHLLPLYVQPSNKVMVMHYGEIGQQLVVVPKAQLVVVRYIDEKNGRKTNATGDYRYLFQDEMLPYVAALAESVHID